MSFSQDTPTNEFSVFSAAPRDGAIVTPPPAAQTNFGPAAASTEFAPSPAGHEQLMKDPQVNSEVELNVLKQLQDATNAHSDGNVPAVSKDDLAKILEGFAKVLRGDEPAVHAVNVKQDAELGQLKELLMDAQGTIISLLNDRVFDRAKIARLESEMRLIPDLQAQATRAMGLALRSEEVQKDLSNVKSEVERLRTSYVRADNSNWIGRLFGR